MAEKVAKNYNLLFIITIFICTCCLSTTTSTISRLGAKAHQKTDIFRGPITRWLFTPIFLWHSESACFSCPPTKAAPQRKIGVNREKNVKNRSLKIFKKIFSDGGEWSLHGPLRGYRCSFAVVRCWYHVGGPRPGDIRGLLLLWPSVGPPSRGKVPFSKWRRCARTDNGRGCCGKRHLGPGAGRVWGNLNDVVQKCHCP